MALMFGPARGYNATGGMDWFFHIPRTGGNYTIRACVNLNLNGENVYAQHKGHAHGPPGNFRPHLINRCFCTVRPPLDWYQSFYRFRIVKHYIGSNMAPGHELDKFIWKGRYQNGGRFFPFDYFVREVQRAYPGYVTDLYRKFTGLVDAVLSTDTLSKELPALLLRWGYDEPVWTPPKRKNATRRKDGEWVKPRQFKRWTAHGPPVDELPVDLEPATLKLMEEREYKIIEWLRERRIIR